MIFRSSTLLLLRARAYSILLKVQSNLCLTVRISSSQTSSGKPNAMILGNTTTRFLVVQSCSCCTPTSGVWRRTEGYLSYINGVTRPNEAGGTCIDHIYGRSVATANEAFLIKQPITDHYLTALHISTAKAETPRNALNPRSLNLRRLVQLAERVNWDALTASSDLNVCLDNLVEAIKDIVERATVTHCGRNVQKRNKPRQA